jgi:hypothetical protein
MFASYYRQCYLVCYLLTAFLPCLSAAQLTFPATLEVDLIFPRNDTYAPTTLMPIVFAIQNSHYAAALDVKFDWTVWQGSGYNTKFIASREVVLKNADFSSSDPFFAIDSIPINTTEGVWWFTWTSATGNCSDFFELNSDLITPNISLTFQNLVDPDPLIFTTKNGTQQPDLVAATADGTCNNTESFTYNVTRILNFTSTPRYDGRSSCAVLESSLPAPDPNPCGVTLNASVASSISAALTSCASQHPTVTACLLKTNDGFSRAEQLSFGRMAWLIASWVLLMFLN